MRICKEGYLNIFVMPTTEGGKGLCEWMVGIMNENKAYTSEQVHTAIQDNHPDEDVKLLTRDQITLILEWMIGKTFNNVTLGNVANQQITYVISEE